VLIVDPSNPNIAYAAGDTLSVQTTDGGASWNSIIFDSNFHGPHADAHAADRFEVRLEVTDHVQAMSASSAQVINEIFREAGLAIVWAHSRNRAEKGGGAAVTIAIEILERAPRELGTRVLAGSTPFSKSGARTVLYFDRIEEMTRDAMARQRILGHVLAHEIFHILQGGDYHSSEGLMHARWTLAEYRAMSTRALALGPEEAFVLRAAIARIGERTKADSAIIAKQIRP
jgi:hypothetical protein